MNALHTDLYQLTMAAGYFDSGKASETAVFELFVRRLPANRDFLIAAGLQQAVEYLLNLRFTAEQIDYLRTLSQFHRATPGSGTICEHSVSRATCSRCAKARRSLQANPSRSSELPSSKHRFRRHTCSRSIGYQSMIAAKAARVAAAARPYSCRVRNPPRPRPRSRRPRWARCVHRGCAGTSNVEAGHRFGIPVFGTSAHSWVLAFRDETEAFQHLQKLLGQGTVYLIDTYDTVEGARKAAALGRPIWGVRLDSGDLGALAMRYGPSSTMPGSTRRRSWQPAI